MAKPIVNHARLTAELTGRALLDTLHSARESSTSNPVELGSRFLIELRAKGMTLVPTPTSDGIYRRDLTQRVAP